MTDLEKLKEILNNQDGNAVWSGNWERLSFEEKPSTQENNILLIIDSLEVGFSFSKNGHLIGAFNFKQ
jgi:hypothetical protein